MTKDMGSRALAQDDGGTWECAALTWEVTVRIGSIKFEVVPPSASNVCTMHHETEHQEDT